MLSSKLLLTRVIVHVLIAPCLVASSLADYCSVLTPYYKEDVLFSSHALEEQNEDGVSILFYLQKIYPGSLINILICE
jgi:hypothetical protein